MDAARIRDDVYRHEWTLQHLPILIHEYQHSVDHLGTVAGRRLLDTLVAGLVGLSKKLQGDISGLPELVAYHDHQRLFYRKAYFTEILPGYRPKGPGRPKWSWGSSIGTGFDHLARPNEQEPIIFARFTDEEQQCLVARQPLTAAALFETRAVFAELDHEARHVAQLGEGSPEWDRFNKRQQDMFYDHKLTIYSAPAHIISSRCAVSDPIDAYRLAAKVAGVVLNLVPAIELDPELPNRINPNAAARAQQLQAIRDPGYLFAAIAFLAPRFEGDDEAWLSTSLANVGLPPVIEILDQAQQFLTYPTASKSDELWSIYMQAVAAGVGNFMRLRESFGLLDFQQMSKLGTVQGPMALPHVFLAGDQVAVSQIPIVDIKSQEVLVNASTLLHEHLDELLGACR